MKNILLFYFIIISNCCFSQELVGTLTEDLKNSIIIQGNQLVLYDNSTGTILRSYSLIDDINNRYPSAFLTRNKKKVLIMNNHIVEVIDIGTEKRTTYQFGMGDQNNFLAVNGSKICKVAERLETHSFLLTVQDLESNNIDESFSLEFSPETMSELPSGKVFGALSDKHIALFFQEDIKNQLFIISRPEKKVIAEIALDPILIDQPGNMLFSPADNSLVLMHSGGIAYYDITHNKLANLENDFMTSAPAFITPDNFFVARSTIGGNKDYKFLALPGAAKEGISMRVTDASYAKLLSNGNVMALKYKNPDPDSIYIDFILKNEILTLLTINNDFYILTPNNQPERVKDSNQNPFVYDVYNTQQDAKLFFNFGGKSNHIKLSDLFSTIKSAYIMGRGFHVYDYSKKETIFKPNKKQKEYLDSSYLDFVLRDGKIFALTHILNDVDGDSFKVIEIQNGTELFTVE